MKNLEIVAVVIIVVVLIVAFFLKGKRYMGDKLLAVVFAAVGLAVAYIPMGCGWQIFWSFVVCGGIVSAMDDGSIISTKEPSQAIGLLMVAYVPLRIVFIDWLDWNIGWLLLAITCYWCYEYISSIFK